MPGDLEVNHLEGEVEPWARTELSSVRKAPRAAVPQPAQIGDSDQDSEDKRLL